LYDPIEVLQAISNLVVSTFGRATHPGVPAQSLKEFIDYAKANPGKLSYGHAGVGSLNHLTGEMLKSLTGNPDIVHVPYRGTGPATADTIAGQVAMVTPAVTGPLLEFHRTGKLRILAVTSPARLIAAPDIPTALEAGVPGMISQQSIGLFAPTGTPKAIIEQISQAAESRKAAILEAALDAVITIDHEGRVVEFNPAAERTFGRPRETVLGRDVADLIVPPTFRERHRQGLAPTRERRVQRLAEPAAVRAADRRRAQGGGDSRS